MLNKIDRLKPAELAALKSEFPDALFLSATSPSDVAALRLRLIGYFETDMVEETLFIPYDVPGAIGEIRAKMRVLEESYDEKGTLLKIRAHKDPIERLKSRFGLKTR